MGLLDSLNNEDLADRLSAIGIRLEKKIIDISQPLFSSKVYPGDKAPSFERVNTLSEDKYNLTNISLSVHNGTHIDSPRHFLDKGIGVGNLELEIFYGKCVVKEWDGVVPAECKRLLIKGNYVMSAADARDIVNAGVKLVGVESQSVGPMDTPEEVHKILLEAGVIPLEGLMLSHVALGSYILSAFPLNLGADCDGSPVRAVLIPE
ncbi:MAG: cyclase family protein [Clostridioides sp.]|jgi:arylformamidase|nr:cyclase family protein [Clostridioides sp.]